MAKIDLINTDSKTIKNMQWEYACFFIWISLLKIIKKGPTNRIEYKEHNWQRHEKPYCQELSF